MTRTGAVTHDDAVLEPARGGHEDAFTAIADRFRPELQLHCYRILGSVQDAEDLVQETLMAAWRGLDAFEADPRCARGCTGSRRTGA